ncbi:ABC transporter permease, partial [Candidatus Calescamantes bacterium]|nr:ABC transporter permease [Candidatus Calescamantes bacterium]
EHGVPDNIWDTVMVKIENIASEKKMKSMFLAMLLPYMLILITMSGASYPATDLSVGEKERGTLETLLAASILRKEIVIGKYLTTVLVALVSSASSLISISLTFRLLPSSSQFAAQISFQTMITAFFAILPVAMIFSALVFAIASFAKSMKEAQGYIGPLTMAVIFPAMVSIFPGFEADMSTVFIPIVNISLLLKNIILGDVRGYYLIITLLESFLLAGFFIIMAFRLFDRESVIFKGE